MNISINNNTINHLYFTNSYNVNYGATRFFSSLKKYFSISYLKNKLIEYSSNELIRLITITEGLQNLIAENGLTEKEANTMLDSFSIIIKKSNKFFNLLQSINFLDSDNVQQLAETCLITIYDLRSQLQQLAVATAPHINDSELHKIASAISLNNLVAIQQ